MVPCFNLFIFPEEDGTAINMKDRKECGQMCPHILVWRYSNILSSLDKLWSNSIETFCLLEVLK